MLKTITLTRPETTYKATLCFSDKSLPELLTMKESFLHPDENTYFERLIHEKRQLSFLIGRYCAKKAINQLLEKTVAANEINIDQAVFNYPVIKSDRIQNIAVSISHSAQWGAAIAYPESHPISIDIELIDGSKTKAIESQLTGEDLELMQSIESINHSEKHTMMWTIKESLSKALKTGMMTPFSLYEIKSIEYNHAIYTCEFKNFAQYKTHSFKHDNVFCSIILPKKTAWDFKI